MEKHNGQPVILAPDILVPQSASESNETYWLNKLIELLSRRVAAVGLKCNAVQEFHAMGGGWAFMFSAVNDPSNSMRRCEAYLLFSEGVDLGGNVERMVEAVYRRLMESLEAQDVQ